MLDPQGIADELLAGERERREIPQFSKQHGIDEFDLATAYRAQRLFVAAKVAGGQRFVGYKLGLTSRNKQQAMGVDAPLFGRVTSGMLAPFGEPVRLDRFIHPRVESEIAFLLARDVEPPATVISVLAATEVVFGAVDVLDSRYEGFASRWRMWWPTTPARARSIWVRGRGGSTSWRICGCWAAWCGWTGRSR